MITNSNYLFELAFNSASEGLVVVNKNSEIRLVNRRLLDLFGYDENELISAPIEVLIPQAMRSAHVGHRNGYHQNPHSRSMGEAGMKLSGQRKDGSLFPVEVSLNFFSLNNERYVMALVMDVTVRTRMEEQLRQAQSNLESLNEELESLVIKRTKALEESQQLYQSIAHNFPDGIITVVDDKFKCIFVDGQDLKKFGLNKDKLIGSSYLSRFEGESKQVISNNLKRLEKEENLRCEILNKDEHYEIHMVRLGSGGGSRNRYLVVELNITKQKLVEIEQARALQKEKELGEMKSRFVSMASHEFRTPLSAILSSASLIEKYENTDQQSNRLKHTDRIKSSVSNLTDILNDFLSFEKLNENKVEVTLETVNLCELINYAVEELEPIRKPGQKFTIVKNRENCVFESDGKILKNVLLNLFSNGLKYSGENGVVSIDIDFSNELLEFSISDNGIGIPEGEQKNLFERFFRAENVSNIQGTGLGLNIVKKYVELLGGKIEFESQLGKGTTFYIKLPINHKVDE
ncbi:MAG: PAS domain S-box protein [Flavobacteriales bacterium]|nr:PAS domain S-box protein [Flavobacteriales bacterium]MCB9198283.1 PAS domain S-box protein [Flavobacteriales bacterium]